MVGGERGRDGRGRKGEEMEGRRGEEVKGRRGGKGEGWRGDGVVWSGIGRGAKLTHLGSNVACVRSCSLSPVSVHGRWPLFVVHGSRFGWWWLARVVVGDGEERGWASPRRGCCRLCPFMGAGHQLWAVVAGCGCP